MHEDDARLKALIAEAKKIALRRKRTTAAYFLSLTEIEIGRGDLLPDLPELPAIRRPISTR